MSSYAEHGQPYQRVDAKRSFDSVPVSFDWHDYLASKWAPGITVTINSRIRQIRSQSNGLQLRAMNDGVTGRRPFTWPKTVGDTVTDGSLQWEAEAIDSSSLRTFIATSEFPAVDGVTFGLPASNDLVYQVMVDGGTSGQEYKIRHQVVLANGEEKEGVAVLPVLD